MAAGTKITKASPAKQWEMIAMAVVSALGILSANSARRRQENRLAEQQELFETRMKEYEELEYEPLDLDALKLSNVYEDLDITEDVLAGAEMGMLNFQRSQARILQASQQSGTAQATVATELSRQGTEYSMAVQQNISQQLAQRKLIATQEQAKLNERMARLKLANMEGKRTFEYEKLATLMGVQGERVAGAVTGVNYANQGVSQAYSSAASSFASMYAGQSTGTTGTGTTPKVS